MKTRLLLLALLAVPLAARADSPSDETVDRIEAQATLWADWQARAAKMESDYIENVTKVDPDSDPTMRYLAKVDQEEALADRRQREWRDVQLAKWRTQSASGAMTPDEADRRAAYVERLYRLRMLLIYGNIYPRILDESYTGDDGRHTGRFLAAPDWAIAASRDDILAVEDELVRRSGLSKEDAFAPKGPQ